MREIMYSKDARQQILSGVNIISKAVKVTLGPSGRNVLIRNADEKRPFSTKDGVTVAGQVASNNPLEMTAIESIQDVANNSDNAAGDGTTTATVIAEAILTEGLNFPEKLNLLDIKRGIDLGTNLVVEQLKKAATPIEDNDKMLRQVAMISSNHDKECADIVFDAFKIAGKQGIVNIKRSRSYDTYLNSIEGMTLPMGYRSKYYVTDSSDETCVLESPWVYMTNKKITKITDNLEYVLSKVAEDQHSLLIICPGMDGSVSEVLIQNKVKGSIKVCVAKSPGFGNEQDDLLHDLGIVLGKAPFIENEGVDFEALAQEDIFKYLPRSEEITIGEHNTSFKSPAGLTDEEKADIKKSSDSRADALRDQIADTLTTYEKSVLQARISRLSDGIAFINIGARSETEFIEKQGRIQDSLHAIKYANEEGIIPGGGAALLTISTLPIKAEGMNESVVYGANIVMRAIRKPFFQILENVGILPPDESPRWRQNLRKLNPFRDPEPLRIHPDLMKYLEYNFVAGFDAKNKTVEGNMIEAGIIDPVKVTRTALESAGSVAGMLLTTECMITDPKVYQPINQEY